MKIVYEYNPQFIANQKKLYTFDGGKDVAFALKAIKLQSFTGIAIILRQN